MLYLEIFGLTLVAQLIVLGLDSLRLISVPTPLTYFVAGQQTATLHVAYGSLNVRVVRLHLSEALESAGLALDEALTLVAGQTLKVTLIYTAHTRNAEGQHAGV